MEANGQEESGRGRRSQNSVTAYQQWQKEEGLPVYRGSFVSDLYSLELGFWERVGQNAAFVNLAEQEQDDGWVIEIAPRGRTEVLHHAFEAMILVLEGRGATTFWQPNTPKQTVEWQRGSLFAPPLNCHYQHFNLDGERPARLWAVTSAPMMMNMVADQGFVWDNPYVFAGRYGGEPDFFTRPGVREGSSWRTNFVPDVRAFELETSGSANRGVGVRTIGFWLGNNSMHSHISQWPSGTYKKAHCHREGAHVTILNGQGYTLLWSEGEPYNRVDWKDGTVLSPCDGEYHQHFNTGADPCSFIALKLGTLAKPNVRLRHRPEYRIDGEGYDGGIPYEDEDPAIYSKWLEEITKSGVTPHLLRPEYVAS